MNVLARKRTIVGLTCGRNLDGNQKGSATIELSGGGDQTASRIDGMLYGIVPMVKTIENGESGVKWKTRQVMFGTWRRMD